jgi:UDP-glucose 4-epimerase
MAHILVTGGAGYVGSICCAELLDQGHSVVVVDDLSTGHEGSIPSGALFRKLDIADRGGLSRVLAEKKVDAVFHFAAKALIPESVTNPGIFFDVNVASGIVMLETLRAAGVRHFVFSSSAAVYGNPIESPIPEDHPKAPVNSYGETKLVFEQALRWYASAYHWSVFCFRYFNACGATPGRGEMHLPETHIIPLLFEAALGQREHFSIFGDDYPTPDGTCLRDYVHVLDIARAHLLALKVTEQGFRPYNIGTGTAYSVLQVVEAVQSVTGLKLPVRREGRREGDPAVLCACPNKLKADLGWRPGNSDLKHIIETAWEWAQISHPRQLTTSAS